MWARDRRLEGKETGALVYGLAKKRDPVKNHDLVKRHGREPALVRGRAWGQAASIRRRQHSPLVLVIPRHAPEFLAMGPII